ncbi:uncharacterized protein LOC121370915 [Gigantopelta aegis]|uniref:uncharacterized protein LOC121370915 n=1 Tax=Gigantopelta aegis TaxID=1735272 RepID=UPI001B88D8D5|nr:uncharacterized protein LOC121370915 [Gigantopelta aegis]
MEMKAIEEKRQSASTKRNTKWGMNVFEAWCVESGIPCPDFTTVEATKLALLLRSFYASTAPLVTEGRKRRLPEKQVGEYHKNTLINIRGALNRHLHDSDRNIDIVKDKSLKKQMIY